MRRLLLVCLFVAPLMAQDRLLEWMDRIAQEQLSKREAEVSKIHTIGEAEMRKSAVRGKILELIGGLPDYTGPLNARITGRIEKPRYVIEKVVFESLPRLYVTANLYRPVAAGRYPGVLFPLGHWLEGKSAAQRIASNLAVKGFVVLAYDPLGQGERLQAYDRRLSASLAGGSVEQHLMAGAQAVLAGESFARYRIWDAKRALDYLISRPEVDAQTIGCTGCSGGGTLTTYVSALDARIKVAAPACYINTFRLLFAGPTGDSEQSIPYFLSSGLDIPDYVELFAPKPWLIASTEKDFFPLEGARRVYEEAQRWYRIYQAEDKIRWTVGPGGHGTPLEIREAIYDWMTRWLKDGRGDTREEALEMLPDFDLRASEAGQVDGRDIYRVILERFRARRSPGTRQQMLAEIRKWSQPGEPDIQGTFSVPPAKGRHPAVLLIDAPASLASHVAQSGAVALNLKPRGLPVNERASARYSGDWLINTRAWLIGRSLAGMRVADIIHGVDQLAARPDVNATAIGAHARNVAGVWLLMAATVDPRINRMWLDRTPHSLRVALENPLHRNLHDAIFPGFALHWDLDDLVKSIAPRKVIWSDPTDWMGAITPRLDGFLYRTFEESDDRFLNELTGPASWKSGR
jgi:hypothetical protein